MKYATRSTMASHHRVKALFLAVAAATAIGLTVIPGPVGAKPQSNPTIAAALSSVWSMQFADAQFATVDPSGNVIAVCNDNGAVVVTKYDANGSKIGSWTFADSDSLLGVATDPSGNMLVTTSTKLTGLTSAGAPNFSHTPTLPIIAMAVDHSGNIVIAENNWDSDLVIEKLSASGVPLFNKTVSSTGGIEDLSLATDSVGNIIVALAYQDGTMNFGGAALTAPYMDTLIVAKLSPSGSHVFSKISNPTVASDGTYAGIYEVQLAIKSTNEIVITGTVDGSGSMTIGGKKLTLPPEGGETMFLSQFSTMGAAVFAKTIGVDGVHPEAIAIDNQDNVVITGEDRSAKFLGVTNGVFVAKVSGTNGNLLSSNLVGSTSGSANSIAVNQVSNDVVTTGTSLAVNYMMDLVN